MGEAFGNRFIQYAFSQKFIRVFSTRTKGSKTPPEKGKAPHTIRPGQTHQTAREASPSIAQSERKS